jgi:hypothetical protein
VNFLSAGQQRQFRTGYELTSKGVVFTRYDGMDQDEMGVWTTPGDDKVAWFTDPGGNLLSLTQFVGM